MTLARVKTWIAGEVLTASDLNTEFDHCDNNLAVSSELAASSGSSLTGFIQAGTGAVARTMQSKGRDIVSVKDFGAIGDGTTNDTSAIQAAINFAVVSTIVAPGNPCCVIFPHGTYKVTDVITISGAVALVGEGAPMSISGARIIQSTAHKSLFSVVGATNAAIYMAQLLLQDNTGVADSATGLFYADAAVTSGNSFYFRDCWFGPPSYWAINIQCASDDLQIIDCTFDVTAQKFISVGSVTKQVTNLAIQGNTFYGGYSGLGFIDCYNVAGGIISDNRMYSGGAFTIPYAITFPNALSSKVIVANNTCIGIQAFLSNCQSNNISVLGNIATGLSGIGIGIGGAGTISGWVIEGNSLTGASGVYGLIDCTGTALTGSIIQGNTLVGNSGGTSAYALNLAVGSIPNNIIKDNKVTGCTVDNANYGSYAYSTWTPGLQGTSTSGTYTYSTQTGTYTKNGREVTLHFDLVLSAISVAGTGEIILSGQPFTAAAVGSHGACHLSGVTFPSGTMCTLDIDASDNKIRFIFSGSGIAAAPMAPGNLSATAAIHGTITYAIVET